LPGRTRRKQAALESQSSTGSFRLVRASKLGTNLRRPVLRTLILYGNNQLSGTIPPELGDLVNLQEFSVGE